uniref:Putative secreted protein n=1 Tax=Anopheles marajoara TaxID=58244 RepID=A0A2M4C807_9DIPT
MAITIPSAGCHTIAWFSIILGSEALAPIHRTPKVHYRRGKEGFRGSSPNRVQPTRPDRRQAQRVRERTRAIVTRCDDLAGFRLGDLRNATRGHICAWRRRLLFPYFPGA